MSQRRPIARPLVVLGLVLVTAAAAAGCGDQSAPKGSKAFCSAANRYNTELEREQKAGTVDVEHQIARVAQLVTTAPKAIRADAQRFLDALQSLGTDPSVKDDPAVKRAVDAVNRYANQACGVYTSSDM